MGPKPGVPQSRSLFQQTLLEMINPKHPLEKLYTVHAPEVECIFKGKARKPYESGGKVSVATTLREGLVVGMRSMPRKTWDGYIFAEPLGQMGIFTNPSPRPASSTKATWAPKFGNGFWRFSINQLNH